MHNGRTRGGIEEGLHISMPWRRIAKVIWIGEWHGQQFGLRISVSDLLTNRLDKMQQVAVDIHGTIDRMSIPLAVYEHGPGVVSQPRVWVVDLPSHHGDPQQDHHC